MKVVIEWIPDIQICDKSNLLPSQLILYTGQGPTAAHYPHVVHDSSRVWCVCVHLVYTCVYIYAIVYLDNLNCIKVFYKVMDISIQLNKDL